VPFSTFPEIYVNPESVIAGLIERLAYTVYAVPEAPVMTTPDTVPALPLIFTPAEAVLEIVPVTAAAVPLCNLKAGSAAVASTYPAVNEVPTFALFVAVYPVSVETNKLSKYPFNQCKVFVPILIELSVFG
jgi:hypothetical protein